MATTRADRRGAEWRQGPTTSCRSPRNARTRKSRRPRGCLRADVGRQRLDHVPGGRDRVLRRLAVELDRVNPFVARGLGGLDDRNDVVVDVLVVLVEVELLRGDELEIREQLAERGDPPLVVRT